MNRQYTETNLDELHPSSSAAVEAKTSTPTGPAPESRSGHYTIYILFTFSAKIIDLPGGYINDPFIKEDIVLFCSF